MDGIHPHFAVRASFSFLLLILLQTSTEAQICSAPLSVPFAENNTVGAVVTPITVGPGVTLAFAPPPANPDNPFRFEGNNLVAAVVLDREKQETHVVQITCEGTDGLKLPLTIIVSLTDKNDNSPVFSSSIYTTSVEEMSPKGKSVGSFPAKDLDSGQLYYRLTPESSPFKLLSATSPVLQVDATLDYDKARDFTLILYAQDTPLTSSITPSHTTSTTIVVNITDVDNRPPWFLPCTADDSAGPMVCHSSGYTAKVVLNEQEAGVLTLKPGPLYAIDGDSGLNEEITYSFLGGDGGGLFKINSNTGNITMLKPADVLGTITLNVLATQKVNIYQFSTTTVSVSVQVKSLHAPKFQKSQYEGVITGVGNMATDRNNKDEPLIILATDDDYIGTGGLNPRMTYNVTGSSDFSIVDGYLFMTRDLPEGTVSLQVVARDPSTDETDTAELLVERKLGLSTTTSVPLSTTDSMTTTSIGESTTGDIMSTSSPSSVSTTISSATSGSTVGSTVIRTTGSTAGSTVTSTVTSMPTEGSISTTNPSLTSEGSLTVSTAHPHTEIVPSGGFGSVDMAALGATLGVLLFICLVAIGVLACRIRRGDADWKKIYETSMFRSSLGQGSGGQKAGIQYTNEAFQNDDDDGDSTVSGSAVKESVMAEKEPQKTAGSAPHYETIVASSAALNALLDDDISQAGSEKAESDKVKPILTKERRMDEGYKSVWFKEDIDPNAKEEVVIIPDSGENDSEEEDEEQPSSSREDDEDDNQQIKSRRVGFNDVDQDSGLGEKMEDPAEDSDDDENLTADL